MCHAPACACVSETAYNEYDSLFHCDGDAFTAKKKIQYSIHRVIIAGIVSVPPYERQCCKITIYV